jgi:hypothetical protein
VLYIDGVPEPIVYREGAGVVRLNPSTRPLHIGAQIDPQSGWFYYHQGRVDELSIYNRALSAEEIQAVYRAGGGGKCATNPPPTFVQRRIGGFRVQLIATPPANASVYAVEDLPPTGWHVSEISHNGVVDTATGKVKFGPFYDAEPRALSYVVVPPPDALGMFQFAGQGSADGLNSPIGGDQFLVLPGPHPADLTPRDWSLVIGETTAYGAAWRRGQEWPVPPVPIPIDYVTRAAALWRGGECYTVDSSVTTEPLWWVNCASPSAPDVELLPSAGYKPAVQQTASLRYAGTATRQAPAVYVPGAPLTIAVAVAPEAVVNAYAVEDRVPVGWTVSGIDEGGEWDAAQGKVKWGPFLDAAPRRLAYQVMPPPTARGTARFGGVSSCDGVSAAIDGRRDLQEAARLIIRRPAPGECQLVLEGRAGIRFLIEASSDLAHWTPLTVVTNLTGRVEFMELDQAAYRQRFYRAQLLEEPDNQFPQSTP